MGEKFIDIVDGSVEIIRDRCLRSLEEKKFEKKIEIFHRRSRYAIYSEFIPFFIRNKNIFIRIKYDRG